MKKSMIRLFAVLLTLTVSSMSFAKDCRSNKNLILYNAKGECAIAKGCPVSQNCCYKCTGGYCGTNTDGCYY